MVRLISPLGRIFHVVYVGSSDLWSQIGVDGPKFDEGGGYIIKDNEYWIGLVYIMIYWYNMV